MSRPCAAILCRRAALVLLAALAVAACGGDTHDDIKAWMKESTAGLKGRVPPLPEIKAFPIVSYDAGDQLDPFKAVGIDPEKKVAHGGIKPDFDRRKEPLESYPLESLKMVGLLQKEKMKHAIIRAASAVYQVKIGNYVGQNFGIITDIKDSEVQIKELIQDPGGDWVERTSALQLQEQEAKK